MNLIFVKIAIAVVFINSNPGKIPTTANSGIKWISFEQLAVKMAQNPKPILIHVYTPWCGYCKRMEQTTFQDASVINYINAHFYAINMNGEEARNIRFNGKVYQYDYNYEHRRNGAHELLIELLNNDILYPSEIFLSSGYNVKLIKRGSSTSASYLELLKEYIDSLS